jgi:phytoene desaturase
MADPGRLRVAVVGAGFGGLAAAIRLQAAGVPTVLFEARDKPGGRAYATATTASPSTPARRC